MCVFVGVMFVCHRTAESAWVILAVQLLYKIDLNLNILLLLVSSEKYDCLLLNEEAQVLFHCIKMKPKPPLA